MEAKIEVDEHGAPYKYQSTVYAKGGEFKVIRITITDDEVIRFGHCKDLIPIAITKGLVCTGNTAPVPIGEVESWIDFQNRTTHIRQIIDCVKYPEHKSD